MDEIKASYERMNCESYIFIQDNIYKWKTQKQNIMDEIKASYERMNRESYIFIQDNIYKWKTQKENIYKGKHTPRNIDT